MLGITYAIAESDPTSMISFAFTVLPERKNTHKQGKQMDFYPNNAGEGESIGGPWLLQNANAGVVTNHHWSHPPWHHHLSEKSEATLNDAIQLLA